MAEDLIRYDILAQDALRGVVKKVLTEVARSGLPGEHHFYITFNTQAAGVRLSPRLLQKYPEDMTIVLQHQFWDMQANEQAVEIGLSFDGIPEKLYIPYTAILTFIDPSVHFSLQFEVDPDLEEEFDDLGDDMNDEETSDAVVTVVSEQNDSQQPMAEDTSNNAENDQIEESSSDAPENEKEDDDEGANGAEVVSLDAFRKK